MKKETFCHLIFQSLFHFMALFIFYPPNLLLIPLSPIQ
jgi:hypothetical protein